MKPPPTKVALDHDDYHAKFVGHTATGRQFFLTEYSGYIMLYLFDRNGRFLEAQIDKYSEALLAMRVKQLEKIGVRYGRIEMAPFELERFGVTFGLIPRPPEDGDDGWWLEFHPGNTMAFSEPFDTGDYDT